MKFKTNYFFVLIFLMVTSTIVGENVLLEKIEPTNFASRIISSLLLIVGIIVFYTSFPNLFGKTEFNLIKYILVVLISIVCLIIVAIPFVFFTSKAWMFWLGFNKEDAISAGGGLALIICGLILAAIRKKRK